MRIEITDSTGTTTDFDSTEIGLVENQHGYLLRLKNDGRVPSQALLEDIAGYELILKSDKPAESAKKYMDYKIQIFEKTGKMIPVRAAIKGLGWDKK